MPVRRWPWRVWVTQVLVLALLVPPGDIQAALDPGEGYPEPGLLFFLGDLTTDTALVTDENGTRTSIVAYLPFGSVDPESSEGPDDFRPKYGGHELDAGSGLYFFGARYYHPTLGRFLQPDPMLEYASPYLYAGNDPLSLTGPDGQAIAVPAVVVVGAVVGAVAGAYAGGAAINGDANPAHWDWSSGGTYAGIFAGALIGAAGGAAAGAASTAGVATGIAGEIAVGTAEGAAFAALGGGGGQEIVISAATGGLTGAVAGSAGAALGSASASAGRSTLRGGSGLADEAALAGRATSSTRAAVRAGSADSQYGRLRPAPGGVRSIAARRLEPNPGQEQPHGT